MKGPLRLDGMTARSGRPGQGRVLRTRLCAAAKRSLSRTPARAMLRKGIRAECAVRTEARMAAHNLRERLRLWFLFNEPAALWVAILGVALIVGGLYAAIHYAQTPTGPWTDQQVTIVAMGNLLTDTGNVPQAVVRLKDRRRVTVTLNRTHTCQVGDPIVVSVGPERSGIGHGIRSWGCNA